jgi:hypothetical protein
MELKEIEEVVDKSFNSELGPYSEVPESVSSLAKGKKRSK